MVKSISRFDERNYMKSLVVYYQNSDSLGHGTRVLLVLQELLKIHRDIKITVFIAGNKNVCLNFKEFAEVVNLPLAKKSTVTSQEYFIEIKKSQQRLEVIKSFINKHHIDAFIFEHFPFGRPNYVDLAELCRFLRYKKIRILSIVRDVISYDCDQKCINELMNYFDRIFVASDEKIFRLEDQIKMRSENIKKLDYCGYVTRPEVYTNPKVNLYQYVDKIVTISAGGGRDGFDILNKLIKSIKKIEKPKILFFICTGPYMRQHEIQALISHKVKRVIIKKYLPYLDDVIYHSDLNISMGGYNSAITAVKTSVPTIISPRTSDSEQVLRVKRFQELFSNISCIDLNVLNETQIAKTIQNELLKKKTENNRKEYNLNGARIIAQKILNETHSNSLQLLYLLSEFPVLSQTFIADTISALISNHVEVTIVSIYKPREPGIVIKELLDRLIYIEDSINPMDEVQRIIEERGIQHIHTHFIDEIGARLAYSIHKKTGIPYTITVHAKDIFRQDRNELFDEIFKNAKKIITVSKFNKKYLADKWNVPSRKIEVITSGKYLNILRPVKKHSISDFKIISVGRLVEKKGFSYLLKACKLLKEKGLNFSCEIVGEGPEKDKLVTMINYFQLDKCVKLKGPLSHDKVLQFMETGTVFVLPCIKAKDNNMDGIPNVLMEAMAKEIPVISTNISGIHELIENNKNGVLVPPNDYKAIAEAILKIKNDQDFANRIRKSSRKIIQDKFNMDKNLGKLIHIFNSSKVSSITLKPKLFDASQFNSSLINRDKQEHTASWEITRACNYQCNYCLSPRRTINHLNMIDIDKVVDSFNNTRYSWNIILTGGEPFTVPNFIDICKKLTIKHKISLDTNLSISKKVWEFAQSIDPNRVKYVYASLHIEEREKTNETSAFIKNVQFLIKKKFNITVNYVMHPRLFKRFVNDFDYFKEKGIILCPKPFKGSFQGKIYPESYIKEEKQLISKYDPKALKELVPHSYCGLKCKAGMNFINIDTEGNVHRCVSDMTEHGNIYSEIKLDDGAYPCVTETCRCFGYQFVERPKILLVADFQNWAYYYKSLNIIKYLSHKYDFEIMYSTDNPDIHHEKYDAIYIFYWKNDLLLKRCMIPKSKLGSGITCELKYYDPPLSEEEIRSTLANYGVFSANSLRNLEEFKNFRSDILYAPNGVDIEQFKTLNINKDNIFTVGWVGNKNVRLKHYYDIILPAINQCENIRFIFATKENQIERAKMPEFYNKCDCLIVASEMDGTPNPALEAAACGIPIISNRIGNMPELIKNGKNGFLVDLNVKDYVDKIRYLRDNREKCREMGSNIKKDIERDWSWERLVNNYDTMFSNLMTNHAREQSDLNFNLSLNEFYTKNFFVSSYPVVLYLESVKGCYDSCIMCRFFPKDNKIIKQISSDLLRRIRPYFKYLKRLNIDGGGDPLLSNKLDYFITICKKFNCYLGMNTTGTMLTKQIADKLLDVKLSIKFSIHAGKPDTYEKIIGRNLTDIKRNIKYLTYMSKIRGCLRNDFQMSYIIMKENIDEIRDFLFLTKELGIRKVRFMKLKQYENIKIGTERNNPNFKFVYSEQFNKKVLQKFINMYPSIMLLADKLGIEIKRGQNDIQSYYGLPVHGIINNQKNHFCLSPWLGTLRINTKGQVRVCCNIQDPIGNIFENDLEWIWNSKKMQDIRRRLQNHSFNICNKCLSTSENDIMDYVK